MLNVHVGRDGGSFDDDPTSEVVEILRKVANEVEGGFTSGYIREGNGNTVGSWSLDI